MGGTSVLDETIEVAADSTDGYSLSSGKFQQECCFSKCSAHSVWGLAFGCRAATGNRKMFYDLKKANDKVVGTTNADKIKACCTDTSAATCADWRPVHSCSSGTSVIDQTTTVAPDLTDVYTLTPEKFQRECCFETPKTCFVLTFSSSTSC